jgi:hypothetical protein
MENLKARESSLIDTDTNLIHVIFRVVVINPVSGPGNQVYMQGSTLHRSNFELSGGEI